MSDELLKRALEMADKYTSLMAVIRDVHSQHADDLCWMDIDKIFHAAGLPTPDRRVGDKQKMKQNCERYIDTLCLDGKWQSYQELEGEVLMWRSKYLLLVNTIQALVKLANLSIPPELK